MKVKIKLLILMVVLLGTIIVVGCTTQSSALQKGDLLFNESRYQEALAEYDNASIKNPNNAMIWIKRGITLDKLQRYPEAISSFSKGAELDPSLLRCNNQSGLCSYPITENKIYWSGIKTIKVFNTKPLDSSIYYCSGDKCLLDMPAIKARSQGAVSYYVEIIGRNSDSGVAFLCSDTDVMGTCS